MIDIYNLLGYIEHVCRIKEAIGDGGQIQVNWGQTFADNADNGKSVEWSEKTGKEVFIGEKITGSSKDVLHHREGY